MPESKNQAINEINNLDNQEERNEEAIDFILRNCERFKTAKNGVDFLVENGCNISRGDIFETVEANFDEAYYDAIQDNHSYFQN